MDILLTGSVAYDYLMTFPGHFKEQILPERLGSISLSFLVDSMSKQRGGVAPNIAYTMALLGERPRVMATVGEDFGEYRAWLDSKGVDTSLMHVVPGVFTASFFATTDHSRSVDRDTLNSWLEKAEKRAKLDRLEGGLWHPYRRKWATERKHHPLKDVAAAGGWKDVNTLLTCYTAADDETVLAVMAEPRKVRDAQAVNSDRNWDENKDGLTG